jgi:hypothetical protein
MVSRYHDDPEVGFPRSLGCRENREWDEKSKGWYCSSDHLGSTIKCACVSRSSLIFLIVVWRVRKQRTWVMTVRMVHPRKHVACIARSQRASSLQSVCSCLKPYSRLCLKVINTAQLEKGLRQFPEYFFKAGISVEMSLKTVFWVNCLHWNKSLSR